MKQPCAICQNTNDTTVLCDKCAAHPYNRDWVPAPRWEIADSDMVAAAPASRQIEQEQKPRKPTALEVKILKLARRGTVAEVEVTQRVDAQGRRNGTYVRQRIIRSRRDIARNLGCSREYVEKVIRRWWSK